MQINKFELGPIEVNAYLIFPDNTDEAILIDAPHYTVENIPEFLKKHNRKLVAILLTHGHWDHMWDAKKLSNLTGAKVYSHKGAKDFIEKEGFQDAFLYGFHGFENSKIDVEVSDGEILEIAGEKIKCLYAPGHADGSIVYYFENETPPTAFVGDVIFSGSIGRTDLPTGNYAVLEKSIREKIYTLPDETVLYVGHGPETSVKAEKIGNSFVRA